MIIENNSQTEGFVFFLRVKEKTEYISIDPGKYVFIDESDWKIDDLKKLYDLVQENEGMRMISNRKSYNIGTERPTKEEFVNRFEIMDMDE